jgi:hypothetical protein
MKFASHDVPTDGGTTTMAVPVLVDTTLVGVVATLVFNTTVHEPDRRQIRSSLTRTDTSAARSRPNRIRPDTVGPPAQPNM